MCQRDIAELVGVNVKTVAARLLWQAKLSREKNKQFLVDFIKQYGVIKTVQFDDLITFEHTKLKQLTVPIAVIDGIRVPLAFGVAPIPTSGHLAEIARERYGKRDDNSVNAREVIFKKLSTLLPPDVHFKSDGHAHYPVLIKEYFPGASVVIPTVLGQFSWIEHGIISPQPKIRCTGVINTCALLILFIQKDTLNIADLT